jgi:uncharacterized membrane protein
VKKLLISLGATLVLVAALGCTGDTGSLRVQVVGENSAGLPGAKVISNEQPSGQLKVTGITGNDGSVTYPDIKAGDYNFYVSVGGYEQKTFDVSVPRGKTAHITITVTPTTPLPAVT